MFASQQEKTFAILSHIFGLGGFIFPLGNVIGTLVWWLIKKDESEAVNDQGKEALNFQITVAIGWLAGICLVPLFGLGAIVITLVSIANLIFVILAVIAVSNEQMYRYPFSLKLVK